MKTLCCSACSTHGALAEHWGTSMRNSPPFNKQPARQNKPPEHPVVTTTFGESGFPADDLFRGRIQGSQAANFGAFSIAQILEYLHAICFKKLSSPCIWGEKLKSHYIQIF